jgi:hypothetical protein
MKTITFTESKLRNIILATLVFTFGFACSASAISVTASATGDLVPETAEYPNTVQNGDFTIAGNSIATHVGDGNDEYTTWDFDFTADPNFASFSASSDPLASAFLTLTLTPCNRLITTDVLKIEGLSLITTPIIQDLPVGQTVTIQFDLLDFYTSSAILGVFAATPNGALPMYYADDAILSYAELTLNTIPEPTTLFLLGLGLAGIAVLRRRKRK